MTASFESARHFADVLRAERQAKMPPSDRSRHLGAEAGAGTQADTDAPSAIGFALSGGGIRSATFCLGVLQSFANRGYLSRFDYLSTVSGGGYIGSWLSAWIHRTSLAEVCSELGKTGAEDTTPPTPTEPQQVTWLRRYSNYLAPRLGLFSGDSLTLITTWVRNVFLNLIVLVAFLVALFLLPPVLLLLLANGAKYPSAFGYAAAWVALLFLAGIEFNLWQQARSAHMAVGAATPSPPNGQSRPPTTARASDVWVTTGLGVLVTVVGPGVLAAFLGAVWLFATPTFAGQDWWSAIGLVAILLLLPGVGWLIEGFVSKRQRLQAAFGDICIYALALSVSVGVGTALLGSARAHFGNLDAVSDLPTLLTIGPSVMLVSFGIVGSLFVGLTGRAYREASREWWSRMNARLLALGVGWFLVSGAAFYAEPIVRWTTQETPSWLQTLLGSTWLASLFTALFVKKPRNAKPATQSTIESLINAAATLFVIGLLILVAACTSAILLAGSKHEPTAVGSKHAADEAALVVKDKTWLPRPKPKDQIAPNLADYLEAHRADVQQQAEANVNLLGSATAARSSTGLSSVVSLTSCDAVSARPCTGNYYGIAWGVTLLLLGLFSWRVDVNKFSLHNLYKNRLVRCYLGASNGSRDAQPFTGFDETDDLLLTELAPTPGGKLAGATFDRGPFHIINTAMNLSQGRNLAWQERKAASFVLTPIYCGFELGRTQGDTTDPHRSTHLLEDPGYRPTEYYAAGRFGATEAKRQGDEDYGFTLGMAMATSGAAASPNMGRGTRPALAFLLTIFNVRLGRWSPNPARGRWRSPSPRFGLLCLLMELFGYSNEERDFVYLSDGGHFDNIGLYELVRRRCGIIVVVDAAADPERKFGDLGATMRKCRIDFGVEIDLPLQKLCGLGRSTRCNEGYSWGVVRYNPDDPNGPVGHILYIKPSLRSLRDEPDDVAAYAATNPTFPQQTTADQFFDESQFESYRKLGQWIAQRAIEDTKSAVLPAPEYLVPAEGKVEPAAPATPLPIGKLALAFSAIAAISLWLLFLTRAPIPNAGDGLQCLDAGGDIPSWLAGHYARACDYLVQSGDSLFPKMWMLLDCLAIVAYTGAFILTYAWILGLNRGNPPSGGRKVLVIGTIALAVAGACMDYTENAILLGGLSTPTMPHIAGIANIVAPISGLKFIFFGLNLTFIFGLLLHFKLIPWLKPRATRWINKLMFALPGLIKRPKASVTATPVPQTEEKAPVTATPVPQTEEKAPVPLRASNGTCFYFAFCPDMLAAPMKAVDNAPSARVIGAGYVTRFRLTFNNASSADSVGCNIEWTGNTANRVYGVVYELTEKDQVCRATATGDDDSYRTLDVLVTLFPGSSLETPILICQTHVKVASRKDPSLRPRAEYLAILIAFAEDNSLPRGYIDWLRTVPTRGENNTERVRTEIAA